MQTRAVNIVRQEATCTAANEQPVLQHRPFLTTRACARGALVVVAAAAAGCGGSSHQAKPPAAGTTTVTVPATTSTTNATESVTGADTVPEAAPATAGGTALLDRVAVGRHAGYDRVVFQFRGDGLPGYRIEYVTPPLKEDGSGDVVHVAGNAFVLVRMEPASGFDVGSGEGELVYKGPKRLPGATIVKEVARTGDFEAVLSWAVGLDSKVPFRVTTAAAPTRLIVDFRSA